MVISLLWLYQNYLLYANFFLALVKQSILDCRIIHFIFSSYLNNVLITLFITFYITLFITCFITFKNYFDKSMFHNDDTNFKVFSVRLSHFGGIFFVCTSNGKKI